MNIEEQLEKLREDYKNTPDPVKRRIIEARAKMLKYAQGKRPEEINTKVPEKEEDQMQAVRKVFPTAKIIS